MLPLLRPSTRPSPSTQILVLEDEPIVRRALADALRLEGREADVATIPGGRARDDEDARADEAGFDEGSFLRSGTIVYDYSLSFSRRSVLVDRLRALLSPMPALIVLSDPSALCDDCERRGVPVFSLPPPSGDGAPLARTRVVSIDPPSGALQALRKIARKVGPNDAPTIVSSARSRTRMLAVREPPAEHGERESRP